MHLVESLRGARLQNQLFAFTLTNQVVNFAQEVIVPFLVQGVEGVRKGKFGSGRWKSTGGGSGKKKRVEWEDEKDGNEKVGMSKEDWGVVYQMRDEVDLEEYTLSGELIASSSELNDSSDELTRRLCGDGYAIWICCDLEHLLAPRSSYVVNFLLVIIG